MEHPGAHARQAAREVGGRDQVVELGGRPRGPADRARGRVPVLGPGGAALEVEAQEGLGGPVQGAGLGSQEGGGVLA